MKKCPFCKANIQDNARFCLYCMKPLQEKVTVKPLQKKRQWWPFAAGGLLLAILIVLALWRPWETDQQAPGGEDIPAAQTTKPQTVQPTDESTRDPQSAQDDRDEELPPAEENQTAPEITDSNKNPQQTQNHNGQQSPEETQPEETKPVEPSPPQTTPITPPEETLPEEETEPEEPKPEEPKPAVIYTYRAARAGDEFNANYQNSGNDIVITGIAQQSADGVYDIPSYIDGKKVIAIVANAFYGTNAKIVYVPATMKNIWNYAFHGCNLTDVYFRGSAIYVESEAFSGSLTIHCSASCSDRNYRYFKNSAVNYGATWEEWNG